MIVMVVAVIVSLGPCFIIAATADKQTDKLLAPFLGERVSAV